MYASRSSVALPLCVVPLTVTVHGSDSLVFEAFLSRGRSKRAVFGPLMLRNCLNSSRTNSERLPAYYCHRGCPFISGETHTPSRGPALAGGWPAAFLGARTVSAGGAVSPPGERSQGCARYAHCALPGARLTSVSLALLLGQPGHQILAAVADHPPENFHRAWEARLSGQAGQR